MDRNQNNQFRASFPIGENEPIRRLFEDHFREFYRWCWKNQFQLNDEQINTIYTDAVMLFRDKAWAGELEHYENCKAKTVLFAFAKRMLKKHFSSQKGEQDKIDHYAHELYNKKDDEEYIDKIEKQCDQAEQNEHQILKIEEYKKLKDVFNQLNAKCRDLLAYCCAYELPATDVMHKLEYKSEDSVKTQKHKCMRKVKSLVNQASKYV